MAQITIYLEDTTIAKIKQAAKKSGKSISQWIARLVKKEVDSQWPMQVREAAGKWNDFPTLSEIREPKAKDIPRELF